MGSFLEALSLNHLLASFMLAELSSLEVVGLRSMFAYLLLARDHSHLLSIKSVDCALPRVSENKFYIFFIIASDNFKEERWHNTDLESYRKL